MITAETGGNAIREFCRVMAEIDRSGTPEPDPKLWEQANASYREARSLLTPPDWTAIWIEVSRGNPKYRMFKLYRDIAQKVWYRSEAYRAHRRKWRSDPRVKARQAERDRAGKQDPARREQIRQAKARYRKRKKAEQLAVCSALQDTTNEQRSEDRDPHI